MQRYCDENKSHEKRVELDKAAGVSIKKDLKTKEKSSSSRSVQSKDSKFSDKDKDKDKKSSRRKSSRKGSRSSSSSSSTSSSDSDFTDKKNLGHRNVFDKIDKKNKKDSVKKLVKESNRTPWEKNLPAEKSGSVASSSRSTPPVDRAGSSSSASGTTRAPFKFPLFGKKATLMGKDAGGSKINIKLGSSKMENIDTTPKVPDLPKVVEKREPIKPQVIISGVYLYVYI